MLQSADGRSRKTNRPGRGSFRPRVDRPASGADQEHTCPDHSDQLVSLPTGSQRSCLSTIAECWNRRRSKRQRRWQWYSMGSLKGFVEIGRVGFERRPVEERIHDWNEVYKEFSEDKLKAQASRCMDCGVPFCHQGCPLGNIIPDC